MCVESVACYLAFFGIDIHWAKDSTVQCADLFPRNETNVARIGQKGCGFRSS